MYTQAVSARRAPRQRPRSALDVGVHRTQLVLQASARL